MKIAYVNNSSRNLTESENNPFFDNVEQGGTPYIINNLIKQI